MSSSRPRPATSLPPTAGVAVAFFLHGASAEAATVSRFSADVSGGLGASSNPYLNDQDPRAALFAELTIVPRYELANELGRTTMEARLRRSHYTKGLSGSSEYGAEVASQRRLDATTNAGASLSFTSSIVGERGATALPGPIQPEPPVGEEPLEPIDPDLALTGLRQRRESFAASAFIGKSLTERDQIDLSFNASRSTFPGSPIAQDYWSYGAAGSWQRTLSTLTSIGVRATTQRTDYKAGSLSTAYYQAQAFFSTRLDPLWSLDGGLGVLLLVPENSPGASSSKSLSGNIQACRTGERSNFCASASRDASGGGLGGSRKRDALDLFYRYRLAEYDSVRVSAGFTKLGRSLTSAALPNLGDEREFLAVSAGYDKRLSQRLAVGASASYRDVFGAGRSVSADISGQVFVRATLGQLR